MDRDPLSELLLWLAKSGYSARSTSEILSELCERLNAAGLELNRAMAGYDTLDPDFGGEGFIWRAADAEVSRDNYRRMDLHAPPPSWETSPFYKLEQSGGSEMRQRLDREDEIAAMPILVEQRAEGATDYLALLERCEPGQAISELETVYLSWSTRRAGGWREADLTLLRSLAPLLALMLRARATEAVVARLMTIYLGADAGRRVLAGEIERGRPEEVSALIWYSDLRGFTALSDRLPPQEVLGLLDDYADSVVEVIHSHGGQVLKFMGDGLLAIFRDTEEAGCGRVLDAVGAVLAAVEDLSDKRRAAGSATSDLTIALGRGTVLYGNIGSRDRLDFTVVGPAVNEAARLEALAGGLEQQVVISQGFAEAAGAARRRLVSLGRYALRGFARPREVFTLDPEAT